ncbi:hypothetical protein BC831DRAFT_510267 [Entophlyctis helioformis]|nr:hypothetical protein BC831DRAFT_510267 [Entophlyctis helioformis]
MIRRSLAKVAAVAVRSAAVPRAAVRPLSLAAARTHTNTHTQTRTLSARGFSTSSPASASTDPPETDAKVAKSRTSFNTGIDAWNAGDIVTAMTHFRASIAHHPSSDAYFNLANCHHSQGDHTQALEGWRKSIDLSPRPDAYVNMANTHAIVLRDTAGALPFYRKALELAPMDGEIHYNFAVVLDAAAKAAGLTASAGQADKPHATPAAAGSAAAPVDPKAVELIEEAIVHYQMAVRLGVDMAEKHLRNAMAKLVGAQATTVNRTHAQREQGDSQQQRQ